MQRKLIRYFLSAILATAIIMGIASFSAVQKYDMAQNREGMLSDLAMMEKDTDFRQGAYETFVNKYQSILKAHLSVLAEDNRVICESGNPPKDVMPIAEVDKAREQGTVFTEQYDSATGQKLYWAAKACDNGVVVCLTRTKRVLDENLSHMAPALSLSVGICLALSMVWLWWVSRHTALPMRRLRDQMKQNIKTDEMKPLPLQGLKDEVLELAVACNDLIDKVNHQVQEIEELQNMRSEFVANVSHELKTPLTSIRGFVETLREGAVYKEDVAMRFLNIIDIEAERLQNLISDILFLSKIEKMQTEDNLALFNLTALTYEVMEILSVQAKEKAVEIEFHPPCEVWIKADESKIKQLIMNLVSNAIRYNEEHGSVYIRLRKPKENRVEIQVSDTGIGMAQSDLDRVFERFYCVDKGRSHESGGTGLGLSIVKHIANLYDGNVVVESTLGQGSSFLVTLCVETVLKERE